MKRYHILTFGCQMNKVDSERIATVLEKKGYKSVSRITEADLIVVNMCSVRQSAVDRVYGLIPKFKSLKAKTILTGCILKKDRPKFAKDFDQIFKFKDLLKYQPKYQNKSRVYIPVSNGCNNRCSYCVVPFTRGPLICRNHKEILKEVANAVKNGSKEIWLLGQNVNDYRNKIKSQNTKFKSTIQNPKVINFAKLIQMVNNIPGDFKFFFTSPHPKNFSEELIEVLVKCKKFGKYLNLPFQSGDNEILKKMRRSYTVGQYKKLVNKIKKRIPDIFLSTDIIVGFPGETKKQFENTVKLFKQINFDMAYIAKYSPRPGTTASKMEDTVSLKEKERRWKILNDILLKNWKEKTCADKKIIVVLGPTASGKSDLAVRLAKKFNGEIISADSRQVYRGMDIGTGKITREKMKGIPHHLLDVASPKRRFTVVQYRKLALSAINKIFKRGKLPILCGGTGFYIQAVIDGIIIPKVKPDWKLRKKLEKETTEELFKKLRKLDPKRAEIIDKNNKRRLIRALEIITKTQKPVPPLQRQPLPYPVLIIGIKKEKTELKKLIKKRLLKRLRQGMVEEVKKLHQSGISWKRLEEFGLEYRFVAQYLQKKISYGEMINLIQKESEHYAERQMTWFKKMGMSSTHPINWLKRYSHAEKLVKKFLEK